MKLKAENIEEAVTEGDERETSQRRRRRMALLRRESRLTWLNTPSQYSILLKECLEIQVTTSNPKEYVWAHGMTRANVMLGIPAR